MRTLVRGVSAYVLVLCLGSSSAAQQAPASLSGIVFDPAEAPVAAARVTLQSVETGRSQDAVTDERGRFRFPAVSVGPHRVSVTAPGFATTVVSVTAFVGQALDVPLPLTIAVNQSVIVAAEAPLIDAARTATAGVITPREIDSLPLNGRTYLDLALLVPGVSRTNTRSNERFAETSAVPGTGLSVSGQRNLANTFVVDGLSANDDAADLAGTSFAEDVIREMQVITSGGTAEFGRTASGVIRIVTQSGTNERRGRAYGFFRHSAWDARNALASRKDPLSQGQFGLTSGGPIARDRTFWFANAERTEHDKNGVVTIAPANVDAINAVLAQAGYGGAPVTTGEFVTALQTMNLFARVDHEWGDASRAQVRYSLYDVRSGNARGVGGLSAVSRGTALNGIDHTVAAAWQTSAARGVLHEVRAQWTGSDLAAPANDARPAISVSGVANIGASSSSPTARRLSVVQASDTVTWPRGAHLVRAGGDLLYNRASIEFPGALQGSYTFTSLANLQRGVYQQYQQAFGDPSLEQQNPNAGFFVQDEWTAASGLTLALGLRYDLQWLPEPIQLDANNVSPRVGFAWSTADRRTVLRGSAGLYFDRVPLRATSNALQRDGVRYKVAVLSSGQEGAPVFPRVLPSFPSTLLTAISTIAPAIHNGRTTQASLQIERAAGRTVSVAAGYSYVRGEGIIMQRNVNVPTLTAAQAAAQGVANLGRPNPAFANITRYESIGDSWAHAMTLSTQARAGDWASVRASYTLSRAEDTSGNAFFSTPQNNADIAGERGPSDNDQRHRVVLSGTAGGRRTAGVELGYVVSYATGVPFTLLAGSDLNADTSNNDRPLGVGRNTARQPSVATVDLRVSREMRLGGSHRLTLLAEAFNVLNRVNILAVNGTFGTGLTPLASFGQPTLAGDPRQIQLGVRWAF